MISGFRTLNKGDSYTHRIMPSPGSTPDLGNIIITRKFLYTRFEIYRKMGQYFSRIPQDQIGRMTILTIKTMNMKRTFGAILTILGIIFIIWGAFAFLSGGGSMGGLSVGKFNAVVPFIVGLIFFISGIGLIKGTKDEA